MKNMTAIGLHFSSDDSGLSDGTGFMAGYATYVEGTISSDYHYNSCHNVTYTYRQACRLRMYAMVQFCTVY